jgi:hypothetical protein
MLKSDYQQCTHNFIYYSSIGRNSQFKKEKRMENKKITKYEFRFEVASERNKIAGYTLIPHNNREAEAQHMTEHDALQAIQRHALKGETEEVKRLLLEFPEFKREDLKRMLIRSVATHGRTLEI